jgi:hypothetical protein
MHHAPSNMIHKLHLPYASHAHASSSCTWSTLSAHNCRQSIGDVDMKNARESMIADAGKAREESLAAVAAIDPYAYGAPGSQKLRAMARELWDNFLEII